jgi:chemotaxis protein CheZ
LPCRGAVSTLTARQRIRSFVAELLNRIGQLTRTLHESLRELGYDRVVEEAASSIPDARERLAYVATLTERAAQRVLNATDIARPIQDELSAGASALGVRWRSVYTAQTSVEEFKSLAGATLEYLDQVPDRTSATSAQLMEIMLAQDFQDLTGQVIKRINVLVHNLEQQLLKLLLESTPAERRPAGADGLLNGPVINAARSGEVVTSQTQVDDLLESLGF